MVPPFTGVAVNVTGSPAQIAEGVPVIVTDGVTLDETTIVIVFDVAVAGVAQAAFDVRTTVTVFPFVSVEEVNVAAVAPATFVPFTCHWYVGVVPPFAGVAVNVTDCPEQIVPEGADVILTAGVTDGLTVTVIAADVAGEPVTQAALEVMITVTASLFARVDEVNVADVAPAAFVPFTCH